MTPKTEQLIADLEQAAIDIWLIPAELLPESYRGKRSHRSLRSVVNEAKRRHRNIFKPGREVSVKFDSERNITSARPERLAILEKYAACVAEGKEIDYDVNEDKQYRAEQTFASVLVRAGIIELD